MNFRIEQLPIHQFEKLGISQDRLKKLPKDEMHNLLSGYPSNMKFLSFKDHEGSTQKVNAKLSVYQTNEGAIGLMVHPYREKIRNDMDLSKKELDQLNSGQTITKKIKSQDYLIQLDQSINELRRVRLDHITIAEAVGNSKLTPLQRTDLLSGKPITLKDSHGRTTKVSLDLTRPTGMRIESTKEQLQKGQSAAIDQGDELKHQEHFRMKR